jgi:hypothetical protein
MNLVSAPYTHEPLANFRRILAGSSHGSHPLSEWALRPTRYDSVRDGESMRSYHDHDDPNDVITDLFSAKKIIG